jgi:hypothetical protein
MDATKKKFYELFIDASEKSESKSGGFFMDRMFEELYEAVKKNDLLHVVSNNEVAVCPRCNDDDIVKSQTSNQMFCWNCNNSWQTDC